MDGVLKSWAVPRGPSLVPGEKRLAVAVEDHPLDYADFEGAIPKGEYGAGDVIVWDRGEWAPIGDARKGFADGRLDFELHGEKLNGRWHLVRMKRRAREKRDNWLLIKSEDGFAAAEGAPDIVDERPDSVLTGRAIGESFEARRALRRTGDGCASELVLGEGGEKGGNAVVRRADAGDAGKIAPEGRTVAS